jgi:homogentisate 1,2-dioxygenase
VTGRRLVLGNGDVRISYVVASATSPYYRNATGDECVYVEAGSGTVETSFGVLSYRTGDYVLVPRATTHRWLPVEESRLYPIEASSHIAPPKRYLSRFGQFLEHAPYCERDLHGPSEPFVQEGTDVEVLVKHRGSGPGGIVGSTLTYATHPLDVVGWDGCLYPYTFNVEDFMPITGKVHQPPPVHQVFEGWNFVICNFLPRKVDYHPHSIPVPYYHSNVDSDEVMFYVGGDYEARKAPASTSARSRSTPAATRTARSRRRWRRRSGSSTSTSPRSWSTPSAHSSSVKPAWPWRTRHTRGPGPAAAPTPSVVGTAGTATAVPRSSATAEVEPDAIPC